MTEMYVYMHLSSFCLYGALYFLIHYVFLLSPGPLALCYTRYFSNLYLHLHHHFPNLDHHLSPVLSPPFRNLYIHHALPSVPCSISATWLVKVCLPFQLSVQVYIALSPLWALLPSHLSQL